MVDIEHRTDVKKNLRINKNGRGAYKSKGKLIKEYICTTKNGRHCGDKLNKTNGFKEL